MTQPNPNSAEDGSIAEKIEHVAASTPSTDKDDVAKKELGALYLQSKRNEQVKTAVHYIIIIAVLVVGIVIVAALTIRIVYLVLPAKWQWMTTEQIEQLDHFLFSGFIGGVLTQAGRKIVTNYKSDDEDQSES